MSKYFKHIGATLIAIIILLIFILLFIPQGIAFATSTDYKNNDWTIQDCENTIDFIKQNFKIFIDEYNKTSLETEKLTATGIEKEMIINLVEDKNYGIYLDFDGDNGYLVATGNYNIYELENKGDLKYLKKLDTAYYSYIDGFLFLDEKNEFQSFDGTNHAYFMNNALQYNDAYNGQTNNGDGEIFDIQAYVAQRYPSYNLEKTVERLASNFYYGLQTETSYFYKYEQSPSGNWDTYWSEGNCALNAMYNLLRSWRKYGYVSIPTTKTIDVYSNISNDIFYNQYGRNNVFSENGKNYKWGVGYPNLLKNMPEVYDKIRTYCINNGGYTPDTGYNVSNVPAALQNVGAQYGDNFEVFRSSTNSGTISGLENQNKASYMSINNSSTYGNHGVTVIGFRRYTYKSGWWIFAITKYAYFYQIADNWNSTPQYFDPNATSNLSLQFCTINRNFA